MSILDKYTITEPKSDLLKAFPGHPQGVIRLEPGGWTFLHGYKKFADAIATFEFEKDDVLVYTTPKSGTTWMQEIIWTMRNNHKLDPEKVTLPLHLRVPNLESDIQIEHVKKPESFNLLFKQHFPDYDPENGRFLLICRTMDRPRTMKYHMPLELSTPTMLDTAKCVYVIRDPRDVCLSYMHHSQIFYYENFGGTQDEYIDAFLQGLVVFGPYWKHVGQAWEKRNHPNMHITFYEKLKKNPKEEYHKLNKFLATNLTPEELDKVIEYTSFEEMKRRKHHVLTEDDEADYMNMALQKKIGGFFRKGVAGNWKNVLTQAQKDKFEAWIKQNCPDQEIMNNILNP